MALTSAKEEGHKSLDKRLREGQDFQYFECPGFGYMAAKYLIRKKKDSPNENRIAMKAKWSDNESESTSNDDSSSNDDEENFTAFIGPHSNPP